MKIGVDFLENGSKYKNFGLNRFGREKTEPNRTEINRFESVFGSVQFNSKTLQKLVWLFILVQNRIGPKMLSPIMNQ
jgi:hypothetical protein